MYLAPCGDNKDQIKYMHKKATAWATSIIVGGGSTKQSMESLNLNNPPNNEILSILHDTKRERMSTHHATYCKIWTNQGWHK